MVSLEANTAAVVAVTGETSISIHAGAGTLSQKIFSGFSFLGSFLHWVFIFGLVSSLGIHLCIDCLLG